MEYFNRCDIVSINIESHCKNLHKNNIFVIDDIKIFCHILQPINKNVCDCRECHGWDTKISIDPKYLKLIKTKLQNERDIKIKCIMNSK